jgi:hypothetical protein
METIISTTTELANAVIGVSSYLPNGVSSADLIDYAFILAIGALFGLIRELHQYFDEGMPTSAKECAFRSLSGAGVGFLAAEFVWIFDKERGSEMVWIVSAVSAFSGYEIATTVMNVIKAFVNGLSNSVMALFGAKHKEEAEQKEVTLPNSKPAIIENNPNGTE